MQSTEHVDKLKEGNYVQWRTIMEALLIAADLWEVVGPEVSGLVPRGVKAVQVREKKEAANAELAACSPVSMQMPCAPGKRWTIPKLKLQLRWHRQWNTNLKPNKDLRCKADWTAEVINAVEAFNRGDVVPSASATLQNEAEQEVVQSDWEASDGDPDEP
ncbi:hypothetical protein EWM64_g4882 [Hericium alpestre]|uniref:DUF4219 domain-containing protein n=1 Tax=Hericium alpestre TaxID=135208 RepID=A0A4Z0A020_9AGAM|nr:hypothetical protein EWM64_g4882 [Hericium alpestre]